MKKYLLVFTAVLVFCCGLYAQPITKAANDAFLITRMAEKFHVQPRPLDAAFSSDLYKNILKELDDDRLFFTQEDIDRLQVYRYTLNAQIAGHKTDLQLLIALYNERILQADTMIATICKAPFNFSIPQKMTVAEDSSWPANAVAMRLKIYKTIKLEVLGKMVAAMGKKPEGAAMPKKYLDSLEAVCRHKEERSFRRSISTVLQSPGGLQQDVCNTYCEKIATCYDPHTEFFPPTEKENFESELGNKTYEFGLGIGRDEDGDDKEGGVEISELKPGSAAYKSGFLNTGDKIMSLQWEGKDSIDVSDASAEEISKILSESNHTKLTMVVKKQDNTTRKVTLVKEKEDNDEDKVKSFLLKGDKTVGYIRLPGFYSDWEDDNKDDNGCANDVAKEIIKLKQENIGGLIIDLRYNGGGSLGEAIALAGIFIDAGPVAQIKANDNKTIVLKDRIRGTIYDGPLIIMVNGYSASASEMVAGTLQDYNRAVIVGAPTYGKATAQVVLPLDTTINLENYNGNKQADSYLKITVNKLYRVSGATAQFSGVQPDIVLPDLLEMTGEREAKEPTALHVAATDANKYYQPYSALPIAALKAIADKEVAADNYFTLLGQYVEQYKIETQPKDVSLLWADAFKEDDKDKNVLPELREAKDAAKQYKVDDNSYEKQLILTDNGLKEPDDAYKNFLEHDPYVKISYDLISAMGK